MLQAGNGLLVRARPAALVSARPRRALLVQANTYWSLQPEKKWAQAHPEKKIMPIDLTGVLGSKRVCSLSSHDFSSTEAVDLCIIEQGGVHVVFDSEGASNPLDSPSVLYVTDVDSSTDVKVDGQVLPKQARTRVKPGALVELGGALFQVQRNVVAHA